MFYYFQCEGTLVVVPMSGSAFERDDNGDRVTELEGDAEYDVDPGTLEILTAEQVATHLTSGADVYDATVDLRTRLAVQFCAGLDSETLQTILRPYPSEANIAKRLSLGADALTGSLPSYEETLAESAVEFFEDSGIGMTRLAAANEEHPNDFEARLEYLLANRKRAAPRRRRDRRAMSGGASAPASSRTAVSCLVPRRRS